MTIMTVRVMVLLRLMMMIMIDDWWLMTDDDWWWLMTDDWWWLMIDDDDWWWQWNSVYGAVVIAKSLWQFACFIVWMWNSAMWLLILRPSKPTWAASSPVGCYSLHPPPWWWQCHSVCGVWRWISISAQGWRHSSNWAETHAGPLLTHCLAQRVGTCPPTCHQLFCIYHYIYHVIYVYNIMYIIGNWIRSVQ